MEKIIIIPDSFKGTLSANEVCRIMAASVRKNLPEAEIVTVPVADGGEGTVDAFLAAVGGERISVTVTGPDGRKLPSFYGLLPDGTAVIEMAAAAGLPLMKGKLDAGRATTYGVGELIRHALENGAKQIVLGLGGSATNDGGCGAAAALGVEFFDEDGRSFVPTGLTLEKIVHIDTARIMNAVRNTPVIVMCDVTNPLCGENGAAAVFAPQKGADAVLVSRLDRGLRHFAEIISRDLGLQVADIPGAGAAGGMGAGTVALLGGELRPGAEAVLDVAGFDSLLDGASLVFTGEGKFDRQSYMGKLVSRVAEQAGRRGVPVICVCGAADTGTDEQLPEGLTALFSICRKPAAYEEAAAAARVNLEITMDNILRLWKRT